MFTKTVSRKVFGKMHKVLLAGLAIVILFAAMPAGKARAYGEIFLPTTIKCRAGGFDRLLNIYGAYAGEWASVRHHLWIKYPRSTTWTYMGAGPWEYIQLSTNISGTMGGWKPSGYIPSGTLVSLKTDVVFSYYGSSSPLYSRVADHGNGSSFCMVY